MALFFNADNDRVEYPTDTAFDNLTAGGVIAWVYLTDDTARQSICWKEGSGADGSGEFALNWRADQAGDYLESYRQRATTYCGANANISNFTAYALNTWLCIAFVFNVSGANSDQKIYMGSSSLPLGEPSSYTSQTIGSGTVGSHTGGIFRIGNGINLTRELKGRVDSFAIFNQYPTLAQLEAWKARPRNGVGIRLFSTLGLTGAQADLTGNGKHGIVTGATLAPHAPIVSSIALSSLPYKRFLHQAVYMERGGFFFPLAS